VSITIEPGLTTIVGANNSGKSQILQLAFRTAGGGTLDDVAYVPADRDSLEQNIQPGGRELRNWNSDMHGVDQPIAHFATQGPPRAELFRLLLNHSDLLAQLTSLGPILERLGFPRAVISGSQLLLFEGHQGGVQGKGLRAVLPIAAALTDNQIGLLLIDEPETALEPGAQKRLRDMLIEWAGDSRAAVVATHSHLFLNRGECHRNYVVTKSPAVTLRQIQSDAELGDVAFHLLGNSVQDLFFPGNFLVVEGASDQRLCERVLEIKQVPLGLVKVFAAGGVSEVPEAMSSIERTLRTLLAGSPYRDRVVCLVDEPIEKKDRDRVTAMESILNDRLIVLREPSIEAAVPRDLYAKANLDKDGVLAACESLKGDFSGLRLHKREVSEALAAAMSAEDLATMPELDRATDLAMQGAR